MPVALSSSTRIRTPEKYTSNTNISDQSAGKNQVNANSPGRNHLSSRPAGGLARPESAKPTAKAATLSSKQQQPAVKFVIGAASRNKDIITSSASNTAVSVTSKQSKGKTDTIIRVVKPATITVAVSTSNSKLKKLEVK